jgi:hypothetical protein
MAAKRALGRVLRYKRNSAEGPGLTGGFRDQRSVQYVYGGGGQGT